MTGVFGVVLGQIVLMFLYLIIGYVLYRTGLITQEGSKALAHLLLYCVLPCVVLKSFCIEYSAKGAVELAVSIAAGAGVLLLSMAVSWLFFRKDPMAQIGVAFSNAGFMGFPLVTAVLGGEAVFYAAGFVALLNALQWTYGQAKLSGDKKYIQLGAVLKNPLVLSLLGGVDDLLLPYSGAAVPPHPHGGHCRHERSACHDRAGCLSGQDRPQSHLYPPPALRPFGGTAGGDPTADDRLSDASSSRMAADTARCSSL